MASTAAATSLNAELVVERKTILADGVVGLVLRDPDGGLLPEWRPGSHLDLVLCEGTTRQYSLCGDPSVREEWRVAVLREPDGRGGSRYVHDRLTVGAKVTVADVRNNFPLLPSGKYLFIAGGIGITPLLPMMAAAQSAGADWTLLYGGRTRASMAFLDELAAYGDHVVVAPHDETGLLDLDRWLSPPAADTLVYCCGPEPLLLAVEQHCASWPAGALQVERFHPKEQTDLAANTSFEVELSLSGLTFEVPADKTVLEMIEQAGVDILSSCHEGTCGTCETVVLSGVPEHRDSLLTDEERAANDLMFVCVSRSRSPKLVLEL